MSWMRKALQVFILGGLFFFSCLSTTAYSAPYPETTALAGTTSQLTIATFNVENLDPRQEDVNKVDGKSKKNVDDDLGSGRFTTLAISIANNLQAPDILALQEVQDNDGAELSSVVNADATAKALIQAIQAAGGPAYEYQDIAPENRKGGGQPGGNIRTAFLFNPQRVKLQELRQLTDLTAFADSRKPLVGEFDFGSSRIAVINNHFASKKGGAAADIQRVQQAEVVKQFVETQLKSDPNANVVVLGDLNDTPDSDALTTLNTAGLHNLVLDVPLPERYSFIFRGNKEQIDHILVSSHLKSAGAEVDAVHINLGTPKGASDHDPALARFIIGGGTSVAVNPIIALSAVLPSVTATSSTDGKIFPGESKRTLIEKLAIVHQIVVG